jgi:hypothetical protein
MSAQVSDRIQVAWVHSIALRSAITTPFGPHSTVSYADVTSPVSAWRRPTVTAAPIIFVAEQIPEQERSCCWQLLTGCVGSVFALMARVVWSGCCWLEVG